MSNDDSDHFEAGGPARKVDEGAVLASIPWSGDLRTLAARYGELTGVRGLRALGIGPIAEGASRDCSAEAHLRIAPLSCHRHPRPYVRAAALPRNAQGKVSRQAVRKLVLATYDFADGPSPALSPGP